MLAMARYLVRVLLVLGLFSPPLSAQTDQSSPFYELLQQHLDSMSRDTMVRRLSQRPEGLSIGDVLPDDMLLRLSDTNLVRLANLLTVSLAQVDSATCTTFLPGGPGPDIISLAARVDSETARQWLRLIHQMMLTGLLNLPDPDFLDDRSFPPHRNPGVIVLPGAQGNRRAILDAMRDVLPVVGAFRELWRASKIVIAQDGTWTVTTFDHDVGRVTKTRYRFPKNRRAEQWVDEPS